MLLAVAAVLPLRRASAAVRHRVWGLMFCGLLLLPAVSYALPAWRVPVLPAPSERYRRISDASARSERAAAAD